MANWVRGLLRAWVVLSVLWVIATIIVFAVREEMQTFAGTSITRFLQVGAMVVLPPLGFLVLLMVLGLVVEALRERGNLMEEVPPRLAVWLHQA